MPARVLQVGHDPGLVRVRELVLAQSGFSVVSVLGNPEPRRKLNETAPFDVFLIAWSTAYEDRKAIVGWMKERWPKIPVIAIHDMFRSPIPGADIGPRPDQIIPLPAIRSLNSAASSNQQYNLSLLL